MTVPGEQATSAFMEPGYRINLLSCLEDHFMLNTSGLVVTSC